LLDTERNASATGQHLSITPMTLTLHAIDQSVVKNEEQFEALRQSDYYRNNMAAGENPPKYQDFRPDSAVPGLLIASTGADLLRRDGYTLSAGEFEAVQGAPGIRKATVELGLFNFAAKAGANTEAYAYAVTPKESGDLVESGSDSKLRFDLAGAASGPQGALAMGRDQQTQSAMRRGSLIGFAEPMDDKTARFGWIIKPRFMTPEGWTNRSLIQGLQQHPLSALISLPAWWDEVELEVVTTWIDHEGQPLAKSTASKYSMRIPMDFEPLEQTLLELDQPGPELLEPRLDPILLTACTSGSIVIPGRRLWRSTRVTLGYQSADEISVLPDMKGIVASFREVSNQATSDEEAAKSSSKPWFQINRPVRVWTSQGAISLPTTARISVPNGCTQTSRLQRVSQTKQE
jgi:hypothetical protein